MEQGQEDTWLHNELMCNNHDSRWHRVKRTGSCTFTLRYIGGLQQLKEGHCHRGCALESRRHHQMGEGLYNCLQFNNGRKFEKETPYNMMYTDKIECEIKMSKWEKVQFWMLMKRHNIS